MQAAVIVVTAAISCGGPTPPPERLRTDIPEPGPGTIEIVGPVFEVEPGQSRFLCMRMPLALDEDVHVNRSRVFQTAGGHHALVLRRPPGGGADPTPHPCEAADMADAFFVATGAADGAGLSLPDGVALELPRDAEIWVQTHYTNDSGSVRRAQDVVHLELIPASEVRELASVFAQVDAAFEIPAGQEYTRTMSCTFPDPITIPWILPHMHEAGLRFEVEVFRDDGRETLYSWSGPWMHEDRHTFPMLQLDDPLAVRSGDGIRTTCTWRNDGATPLSWPTEMCVSFFAFYPGDGSLVTCDQNGVVGRLQSPD